MLKRRMSQTRASRPRLQIKSSLNVRGIGHSITERLPGFTRESRLRSQLHPGSHLSVFGSAQERILRRCLASSEVQMPRYFFNVMNDVRTRDFEGMELGNIEAAQSEAEKDIAEIKQAHFNSLSGDWSKWSIEICDKDRA